MALLESALRSLIESLRLATLGRAGFQQVQLDVHYLRPRVQALAGPGTEGAAAAAALLDELLAAAMERCMQPLMLDTTVLDKILAAAASLKAAGAAGSNSRTGLL